MFIKIKMWIKSHALVSSTLIVISATVLGLVTYSSQNKKTTINLNTKDKNAQNTYKKKSEPNNNFGNIEKKDNSVSAANTSGCGINPSAECVNKVFGNYDAKFSKTFLNIMREAGEKFQTPSAVILAYMSSIHSLSKFNYLFTEAGEEDLRKSLHWGGQIRGCDDLDPMEQGMHDWILKWFVETLDTVSAAGISPGQALNELSEGRRNAASRCNFIDSTYVVAGHFSQADNEGCYASWSDMIDELKSITWGSDPEESYAEDNRYAQGGEIWGVFNACRGGQ